MTIEMNAIFDFDVQVYKTAARDVLVEEDDWDFPCPKCKRPAALLSISAYAERHECLSCKHTFNIS